MVQIIKKIIEFTNRRLGFDSDNKLIFIQRTKAAFRALSSDEEYILSSDEERLITR
jgi:hypothetical protein